MSDEESSESALISTARDLKLSAQSVDLLKRYKRIETDIFYTLSGALSQSFTLPQTEEGVYLSPFELSLEQCLERRFEVPPLTDPGSQIAGAAEGGAAAGGAGAANGAEDADDAGEELFSSEYSSDSDRANFTAFLRDRNPRQVRTQVQPTAFFDMWFRGMKIQCAQVIDLDAPFWGEERGAGSEPEEGEDS